MFRKTAPRSTHGCLCPMAGTRTNGEKPKGWHSTLVKIKSKKPRNGCNKAARRALYKYDKPKQSVPMDFFTPEELTPSERTLALIRQIAYTYRAFKANGRYEMYCLN